MSLFDLIIVNIETVVQLQLKVLWGNFSRRLKKIHKISHKKIERVVPKMGGVCHLGKFPLNPTLFLECVPQVIFLTPQMCMLFFFMLSLCRCALTSLIIKARYSVSSICCSNFVADEQLRKYLQCSEYYSDKRHYQQIWIYTSYWQSSTTIWRVLAW